MRRFGAPTWKALAKAVAHPLGGNHKRLAEEIAKRHTAKATFVFLLLVNSPEDEGGSRCHYFIIPLLI